MRIWFGRDSERSNVSPDWTRRHSAVPKRRGIDSSPPAHSLFLTYIHRSLLVSLSGSVSVTPHSWCFVLFVLLRFCFSFSHPFFSLFFHLNFLPFLQCILTIFSPTIRERDLHMRNCAWIQYSQYPQR